MGAPKFFALGSEPLPRLVALPLRWPARSLYNQKDPAQAKKLLAEAGYKGEPFRILTSQQYDYVYKAALVAMQNLQDAGFTVDLQLMDWASVMSRRFDPAIWESFVTFHGFVPDPALITILSPGLSRLVGHPSQDGRLGRSTPPTDEPARVEAWGKLQDLVMTEAPSVQLGQYFGLLAHAKP